MMGRTLIKFCFAALGMGLASPVLAADYDGQLPAEGFNGMWSCLYARIDGGGSFYADKPSVVVGAAAPSTSTPDNQTWFPTSSSLTSENTGFFEGGVGCQVSDAMRVEMVGGLNLKSSLADSSASPADPYLDGDFSARYVFVSGYWDITNYAGFTPYVGGGIGASYNELSGSHVSTAGTITGARLIGDIDGGNYDFAYHVTFGMSYDMTDNLKLDLAYRYVNFGSANGTIKYPLQGCATGVCSPVSSLDVGTVDAHQVKVGLRYHFGQPTW